MITVTSTEEVVQQPVCSTSPQTISSLVASVFGSSHVHYDIPQLDEQSALVKRKDDSDEQEGEFDDYAEDEQPTHSRSKRMRTSFKHHQLRTMKQYFNLNHNPDAKDLKQLAQKTGLTKRVLQVWFQNARAKFRRSMHGSDGSSISPLTIVSSGVHDCQAPSSSSNHSSEYQSTSPDRPREFFEATNIKAQTNMVPPV
ncbi:hypothetical protein KIN20_023179 [Parelaphostrongylus tenuis]|uniref:Homeobox domain-containing protein n=1 Tax=Parelaphostrongylus tenuis TaxID=148309 RepID=A0AAD5MRB9_PARTN|nr:hypothetical protein KIN20_023179 [Parelaphostrongylus tenuis]